MITSAVVAVTSAGAIQRMIEQIKRFIISYEIE
jgi:hypothetical protein